jgi:hypothetical protein
VPNGPTISLGTLRMFQEYHWLMLRVFYTASVARFGAAGEDAVRAGVHEAGRYRGVRMRDQPVTQVEGRGPASLIRHWDTGEWELAAIDGTLTSDGSPSELSLSLAQAPGTADLLGHDCAGAAAVYWPALLAGVAEGYDRALAVSVGDPLEQPWSIRLSWAAQSDPSGRAADLRLGHIEQDPVRLLEMSRLTAGRIAAVQMYISRELVRRFDAAGEEAVRQAAYQFGAERGSAIRRSHEQAGIPITLESFASKAGLQERDPSEAVFVFSERQYVSAGAYYLDCTFCPLQEVWSHEGAEGLRLGYLFDASNHRGLFQSYHPETIVRWDSVKSRGDSVCRFRFTVPSLLRPGEPTPEEFGLSA